MPIKAETMLLVTASMLPCLEPTFLLNVSTVLKNGYNIMSGRGPPANEWYYTIRKKHINEKHIEEKGTELHSYALKWQK